MGENETLWMRCVEVLFRNGKNFHEALDMADSIMASYLSRPGTARPGLAKCSGARAPHRATSPGAQAKGAGGGRSSAW